MKVTDLILMNEKQAELNRICLKPTVEMGLGQYGTIEDRAEAIQDYAMAAGSELQEFQECFYWKHWSKEAKEGLRWQYVKTAPNRDKAERLNEILRRIPLTPQGSEAVYYQEQQRKVIWDEIKAAESTIDGYQNLRVEIVDLWFFSISLAQLAGLAGPAAERAFEAALIFAPTEETLQTKKVVRHAVFKLGGLLNSIGDAGDELATRTDREAAEEWLRSAAEDLLALLARLSFQFNVLDEIPDLYAKKWQINYDRQMRGRLQVGDTKAEQENRTL